MHDEDTILDRMLENIRGVLDQAPTATPEPAPEPTPQPQGGITVHGNVQNAVNGPMIIRSQTQKL